MACERLRPRCAIVIQRIGSAWDNAWITATHGSHLTHPEHKSAPGARRAVAWLVLGVLDATIAWLGCRGYL